MTSNALTAGALFRHGDLECVVVDAPSLDKILVRHVDDGQLIEVQCDELRSVAEAQMTDRARRLTKEVLELVDDRRWTRAKLRIDALRPLVNTPRYGRTLAQVQLAATRIGRSVSTVYRLLADYDRTGSLRVMLRLCRSDRGIKRLAPKVERVIRAVIKREYLSKTVRITMATAAETVQRRCRKKGWLAPSKTTVVCRIKDLSPADVDAARGPKKHAAPGRYQQSRGAHPTVNQILYECQLDHTPSDLCIVDEEHRLPLEGAQTLSAVLDFESRCVTGFALSMEAPSIRVAGQVVAFAILPKKEFLEQMGVEANWPCCGKPTFLYMDSGPDFTSTDFERALDLHNIHVLRRPKSAPNYAAQIESLFSKFLQEVHQLPGSRFSSLRERLAFDPEGRAIMTLSEFRLWFTIFITMVYHQRPHAGLNDLPPIIAWERGILGYGDKPGIGLPDREEDELALKLDFLPTVRRTIQTDGVLIGHSKYQDALLAEWVGAKNEEEPDGKFVFKSDPFDVSEIYFLHPRERRYIAISRDDPSNVGSVTSWDIGNVKRQQKSDNRQFVDQRTIDAGVEQMRAVRKQSAEKTKAARKARQRQLEAERTSIPTQRRKQAEGVIQFSDAPTPVVDHFTDGETVVIAALPGGIASRVRT